MGRAFCSPPYTLIIVMYLSVYCFILLWGLDVSHADPCYDEWVEYIPGNISLVFIVPHDGNITFPNARKRTWPKPDSGTREIALMMREHLISKGAGAPHMVINKMNRHVMEPNSGIPKENPDIPEKLEAYNNLHGCIQHLVETIPKPGLLVDIHGHKNHNNTLFGYRVKDSRWCTEDGKSEPELLNTKYKTSSVKDLIKRNPDLGLTLSDIMIGTKSMGARLEEKGFSAIPSPSKPCSGDLKYYSGGKLVQWYTSGSWETKNKNAKMDGFQMEIPKEIRLNKEECAQSYGKTSKWSKNDCRLDGKIPEEEKKSTFAKAISDVLYDVFNTYYS